MPYRIKILRKYCLVIISVYIPLIFISCNEIKAPVEVKQVIDKSGSNKSELEKVIKHYSKDPKDSLKLKAAYFLISNMDGWYYYKGELLNQYQEYISLIKRDLLHGAYFLQSFKELYGPFEYKSLDIKLDIEEVKSTELIGNIDMAFKVWREQPWGKDISFKHFCEYILPFRIKDETPEYNREEIYKQFNPVLDSVRKAGGDAVAACIAINSELHKTPATFTVQMGFLPHFPASKLIKYAGVGACRERTDLALYVMRAVGIPVSVDFVQQWPFRSMGHEFNMVLNKEGKAVIFLGGEDNPGYPHASNRIRGKIYRNTFAKNPLSLAMQMDKPAIVPEFLRNPRIKDVTEEYVRCFDITIPLKDVQNNKYAYLSVFNDLEWIPIHWGKIENENVTFTKMQDSAVYLPSYYDQLRAVPANYPFILNSKGQIQYLKPDKNRLHTEMVLLYNFPPEFVDYFRVDFLFGGRFQGANHPDFRDAVDLYTVVVKPLPFMNEIEINSDEEFRYVRYLSPSRQHCQIGEIEFYTSNTKLKGNIITSDSLRINPDFTPHKSMDHDLTTYFKSKLPSRSWVGLDMGKRVKIDKIKFSAPHIGYPGGPTINVIPKHTYELLYWDENKWVSAEIKIAKDTKISFSNVPSNALYLLHDVTTNIRKRIFTYENGKQFWW